MFKRTKIVCTMGPACDNEDTLREMIKAGMNVARFNFSHGSYEEHHERIERVRRLAAELGQPVGILLDTKGPEVRTGLLKDHKKVSVAEGDSIIVTAAPHHRGQPRLRRAHLPRLPQPPQRSHQGLHDLDRRRPGWP